MIFLKPFLSEKIWGGQKLSAYNIPIDKNKNIGEAWLASAVDGKESIVINGEHKGKSLTFLWKNCPQIFGKQTTTLFPILIKFLDAEQNLSVQLHPDDKYAQENEGQEYGKFEAWFILETKPLNNIVFGHNAKTNEEAATMVHNKDWKNFLRELPISNGDCFNVDPGTVHAIKSGTFVYEVQQSSDITYRLYDYDRLENGKLRDLHIKQSLDNIYSPQDNEKISPSKTITYNKINYYQHMIKNQYFVTDRLVVSSEVKMKNVYSAQFLVMTCYEGEGTINGFDFQKGQTWIVENNEVDSLFITGKNKLFITHPS